MPIRLFIAPAGAGKTRFCLGRAQQLSRGQPLCPVWVCVANRAQVISFRQRLAVAGGALGVEIGTFYDLCSDLLLRAGRAPASLEEPLQHRLLRAVIDKAARSGELSHYASLADKPGFVAVLRELIQELKQALVEPSVLAEAVRGAGPRLEELAGLYVAYQRQLSSQSWLDEEELGWQAMRALAGDPTVASDWSLLAVDGFDHLNPTQVALLKALAPRVGELIVTLTCTAGRQRLAQRRFAWTLSRLQVGLGVEPEPLPGARPAAVAALVHLEAGLFEPAVATIEPGGAISWLEAPSPAMEARAALRWVKQRLVTGGLAPREVAILSRDLGEYAAFLEEAAGEFGVPLNLVEPGPLASNPAVAALLGLLRLVRRDRGTASVADGRFPVRETLEALRSPYFDWQSCEIGGVPLGLTAEDANLLEQLALAYQVLAGVDQWREALALRAAQVSEGGRAERDDEEEEVATAGRPGEVWARLGERFERLMARLTPPPIDTVSGYTAFVEDLIGDETEAANPASGSDASSLRMLPRVLSGPAELAARDLSALRALKRVLRGLVWADGMLGPGEPVSYERFVDELEGAAMAGTYAYAPASGNGVWASSVHAARGLSFRAVAILGLSEGQFPRPRRVWGLLREEDRERLAAQGLPLEPEPPGGEFTLFYEAVTRARGELLLSRPYLGDSGQPRAPSPFWEETLRLFAGSDGLAREHLVQRLRSADPLPVELAASWPELVMAASHRWPQGEPEALPGDLRLQLCRVRRGAAMLAARLQGRQGSPFDGECSPLAPLLAARYGPNYAWSASRLEAYQRCPFAFYLGACLGLGPRRAPQAGFDAAQLGGMYHRILEETCRRAGSGSLGEALECLRSVASEVLDRAPRSYGFRPGPLWEQEKARIQEDLANTLRALAEVSAGWQPLALEMSFGLPSDPWPPLRIAVEGRGEILLLGIVDRVDADDMGRLRVIDYKSG
ncbi:MAG: PD-(D/E)XK nuclease family protein, partial [Anaerolineae bacterium]|nr:PD-(D/E)XK nuclease family protein [Anaerolineae bacterium]